MANLRPRAVSILYCIHLPECCLRDDAGVANPGVQSRTLNGAPLVNAWFTHADIANGGTLRCVMGPSASDFGQAGLPPPSLSTHGIQ